METQADPTFTTPIPTTSPLPLPWDDFVVGADNALAHAAVLALARGEPGMSPLLIVGPSGSGKSRLLSGLSSECLLRIPGASLACLDALAFAATCSEADQLTGGWADLRSRFRDLDLLALDNLPNLARSPIALRELEPTLDALADRGAAVAITSTSPPSGWSDLPPRLLDRLLAGLVVRVHSPGIEALRRFTLVRARARGLSLSADAVEALALASEGFGPLEGHLARLALISRVERIPITCELVRATLAQDAVLPSGSLPIHLILKAVASVYRVRVRDLRSADRHQGIVEPRHLAILLARELTGLSFASIGKAFGQRDSKTVRHARASAAARLATDPAFASVADSLRCQLTRWATRSS